MFFMYLEFNFFQKLRSIFVKLRSVFEKLRSEIPKNIPQPQIDFLGGPLKPPSSTDTLDITIPYMRQFVSRLEAALRAKWAEIFISTRDGQ